MNHDHALLAEFYYYTIGDKTTYNQELNDLHVCYTLARGLQLHCDRPRRPALPLEVILRIIRHAGFIDPKPDLGLTSVALEFTVHLRDSKNLSMCYWSTANPLSRTQLTSMARMQLVDIVKSPRPEIMPYGTSDAPSTLWAFTPLGVDGLYKAGSNSQGIDASLYACSDEDEARVMKKQTPSTTIGDTFGPDHEISKQLDEGRFPYIKVISQRPARLMIWRWWEPRF
ncbi:hypothetical protein FRC09_006504 [Ceratobasidium sp. 395]|nr:hypothetical protein FRC09_006504 [Ceratobasidium sp. 395]